MALPPGAVAGLNALAAWALRVSEEPPRLPSELATAWTIEPGIVIPLLLLALLYARGSRTIWARAGRGRVVGGWQVAAFASGWLVLLLTLVSPLHALAETLFSAHMAQHTLMMTVAAPLLVLGRPLLPMLWALPTAGRRILGRRLRARWFRAGWRALTTPFVAWSFQAIAIFAWHLPSLYQATLESELVHALQHLCFLGSALLFWWVLLDPRRGRARTAAGVISLFATLLYTGLLGALLTLGSSVWYPIYADSTGLWGLTPLQDQQLAGLIMWVPAGASYLIALLALFASLLAEPKPVMAGSSVRVAASGTARTRV